MALLSQAGGARASSTLGVAHVNGAGGSGGGGLWGSLSGVLFSRAGEGTAGRRGGAAAEASMAAMAEVGDGVHASRRIASARRQESNPIPRSIPPITLDSSRESFEP